MYNYGTWNHSFAGAADFIVITTQLVLFDGQQQQNVSFTLEPDTVAQEPIETFQIVAAIEEARPLAPNEFIWLTKTVTIIDITGEQ